MLRRRRKREGGKKPVKLTGEEALSLVLDADFSKDQYQTVRTSAKSHNADIFPAYNSS